MSNTTNRPNEPPMPDALAYFLTWTTYGTWLPGDERGWVLKGKGFQLPEPVRQWEARERMTEPECTLNDVQRRIVEETIAEHCRIRNWHLHAVNCRTNHVHVVVTATGRDPKDVRDQFKAWCTRKLKEQQRKDRQKLRDKWWTEKGSQRHIGDEEALMPPFTMCWKASKTSPTRQRGRMVVPRLRVGLVWKRSLACASG